MRGFLVFCSVLFTLIITTVLCDSLESVSDDDLVDMIKSDDLLVVLFAKRNCDDCDKYEKQLLSLKPEIIDKLGSSVVKAFQSQLCRLYSPTKEPAVVFFRHGVPLLYDGPINQDSIYQKFEENKIPIVKELSDENFEHLTQASTGATTGDWFVLFYTQECIDCQRLSAIWEAVGAALKGRMNVARINKDSLGAQTGKRFNVLQVPEFIFIRQGNFYRYEFPNFDVKSFVSFAQEFYKNTRAEKVPIPASPFEDVLTMSVELIKKYEVYVKEFVNTYPYVTVFSACGFGLTAITAIIAKCMAIKSKNLKKKKKSK